MAKTQKETPKVYCPCCNQLTRGGTFKMGHDQRLRGMLLRGETLKPYTQAFIEAQPKSSEWRKLQAEGVKRAEEAVARQAEREAAKAKREQERKASKKAVKAKAKRAGRRQSARRATDAPQADQSVTPPAVEPEPPVQQ